MKQIVISGEIIPKHWWGENEVTEQDVVDQLAGCAPGEDAEILINSPGGDVFTGIAIFNHIREFAKTHTCTVVIQSLVGSIASYIALAAKIGNRESTIKAYDNSVFFIHNARTYVAGDYRELERLAAYAKGVTELICNSAYAKVGSDTVEEIRAAMDAETYYFGAEIVAHGYADAVDGTPDDADGAASLDKNALVAQAKVRYESCMNKLQQWVNKSDANRQLAAKLSHSFAASLDAAHINNMGNSAGGGTPTPAGMEDNRMDIAELKAKHPDVYNAAFNAGVNDERSRVTAHLKMATDSGDVSAAVDFINKGTPVAANEVTAKYHEVFCRTQLKNARADDNPPPVATPAVDKTDEYTEALAEYRKLMLGGKK